jgi:hypothetical protein
MGLFMTLFRGEILYRFRSPQMFYFFSDRNISKRKMLVFVTFHNKPEE